MLFNCTEWRFPEKGDCSRSDILRRKDKTTRINRYFNELNEDQKRLAIRREMAEHNKLLVEAAKNAGVETNLDYAIFQNYGYRGYTVVWMQRLSITIRVETISKNP